MDLVSIQQQVNALLARGSINGIDTVEQRANCIVLCRQVKEQIVSIEDKRKEIVKPLNDQVKAVNNSVKPLSERLDALYVNLKEQIRAFDKKQEDIQKQKQEAITQDYTQEFPDDFISGMGVTPTIQTNILPKSGITGTIKYDVEITDLTLFLTSVLTHPMLSKSVSEYVTINTSKLSTLAKAMGGNLAIDGLKLIEKIETRMR